MSRAYKALELAQDVLPRRVGKMEAARRGGYEKSWRSYFNARSYLLKAIGEDGGLLTDDEILACRARLGLGGYDISDMAAYVERRPAKGSLYRVHVFYGGVDVPYGQGHGHGAVFVRSDGVVQEFGFNRPPSRESASA